MKQAFAILAIAIGLPACAPTVQERVYDLNKGGVSLIAHKDYGAAQQQFQRALELNPEDATTVYNLASAAHGAGDWVSAEQGYRGCLQRQPDHVACRHGLALLLLQQNRASEARQLIETWAAERPELADAQAEKGWLLRELGDLPSAQATLHRALEIDGNNARALAELGIIYETYSYPDRAYFLYERALKRDPHQPEIVARFARLRRPGLVLQPFD